MYFIPRVLTVAAGHSSLSFSGNSYIKYRLSDQLQTELKLTLRIRTLQSQGIVMYMHTERCIILKVGPRLDPPSHCAPPHTQRLMFRTTPHQEWYKTHVPLSAPVPHSPVQTPAVIMYHNITFLPLYLLFMINHHLLKTLIAYRLGQQRPCPVRVL